MDLVIPIVFPDYLITIATPKVQVKIPDLLPGIDVFPDHVRIPGSKQRVSELGHAGVLFINGKTGTTKYYEYGRYDKAALGLTRRVKIPDVTTDGSGDPTRKSLINVLERISRIAGHHGRIEGAYIHLPDKSYEKMLAFAKRRVADNRRPERKPYSVLSNSCMHFAMEVAREGGADIPWILDPRPNSFIEEMQSNHTPLSFIPPDNLTIGETPA